MRGPTHRLRALIPIVIPIVFAALFVLLGVRPAAASRPVIPPEREDEIATLFAPHRLGEEITPGWTFHSFSIDRATVVVWVAGPDREFGQFLLDHPDYAPPDSQRVGSFALTVVDQPPGSEPALAALREALARNDAGRFWAEYGSLAVEGEPNSRYSNSWVGWSKDGLLVFVLLLAGALALLGQALRDAGPQRRALGWGLLAITLLGVGLRLTLAREASLEPWSYTRFMIVARMIYEGPLLAVLQPGPVYMTELITTTVLICSFFAPLTVFAMARYLLASNRAALVCAGIIAVLPMHIRFSNGDVSSIPSLTIAALVFALAHAALREPKRAWLFAALPVFAIGLALTFLLRPLNILYAPLLLATATIDQGVDTDKPAFSRMRLAGLVAVVIAVVIGVGIPNLINDFGDQVREGLSVDTIVSAIQVLFSFEYNTLINPRFMPPGLALLAIAGAWSLAKRKRWRLFAVLVGWVLASLGTHAYVIPMSSYMQARYHLHLVVPFVCLAACGVEALLTRVQGMAQRRWIVGGVFAYLAASPLVHLGFVRDVEFNDQREWAWVHALRETIPAECTILEYGGRRSGARFARVGAYVEANAPGKRWTVIEIPEPAEGEPELSDEVRALLLDPPECAYWFEGLPCFGNRPPNTAIAPVCDAIPGFVDLEEVDRIEFESRPYNENLAIGMSEREPIVLRLHRIHRREPAREQAQD